MREVLIHALLILMAAAGARAASPLPVSPTQPAAPAMGTNQAPGTIGFSTRRLASTSAEEATIRELFRGTVRLLADDRVEFSYDFSTLFQIEDFAPEPGEKARTFLSGPWESRDGFLQKTATNDVPVFHRARFVGPVTMSFKGYLMNGSQYSAGFLDTKGNGQLQAGVGGQPLVMFAAENGRVLAEAPKTPLTGKVQDLTVTFDPTSFHIAGAGLPPLVARRTVPEIGQVFLCAPGSAAAFDDLKIVGRLDLDWFRSTVDSRLTKEFAGRTGPRYGPPPATESQLRQMIKGFKRLLPDGKVELHYDFTDTAQFADWQVIDPHGRADPFAWRVYNGVVHKSQFGPTHLVLQPLLVGPVKLSGRAAIVSGSEAGMGLRDAAGSLLAGFRLGSMGWFLGDDDGQTKVSAAQGVLLNQLHALEVTRDDLKAAAQLDTAFKIEGLTKRTEPLNVVLASKDSTAYFDDVHVVAFLDYDWCVRQLRLYGFKQAALPGMLAPMDKKPAEPGKLSQAVDFSSSSRIKVQANADWQDTRIMLRKGDTVSVAASGSYQYEKDSKTTSGPEGMPGELTRNRPPCPKLTPCALVARIGYGQPFEIGGSARFLAPEMGSLALRINEQPVYDNTGALDVEIVVIPASK
jgi:hypothetical protein